MEEDLFLIIQMLQRLAAAVVLLEFNLYEEKEFFDGNDFPADNFFS